MDLECLHASVRVNRLLSLCIQGRDTDQMFELEKHPDTKGTEFLALLSIFPSISDAFGLISDSAISICKQEIQHEGCRSPAGSPLRSWKREWK